MSETTIKKNFLAKYMISDVVVLFSQDKKKIGIAHIPTIKCSKLCKKYINKNDYIKVTCKLNTIFKKWQPIEIIKDDFTNICSYTCGKASSEGSGSIALYLSWISCETAISSILHSHHPRQSNPLALFDCQQGH